MLRCIRFALGLVLILSISAGTAHAQGWGWGGWGGWGETPQGSIRPWHGLLQPGTGTVQLNTAQARSINTDTFMRWNQYLYEAHLEATRRYVAKRDGDAAKNKATYNEIMKNLQDHPTARDVENGDALNAALDQLSDPRISSSSLKIATAPIRRQDHQGHSVSQCVRSGHDRPDPGESGEEVAGGLERRPIRRRKEGVRGNRRQGSQRRRRG